MKLFVFLLFLVACVHAKDFHKLKRLSSLGAKHHSLSVKKLHRSKVSKTIKQCYDEKQDNDPRTSATGHVHIESAPITSTAPDAQKLLKAWEESTVVGVWPHVQKGALIESVKRRLDNPSRIQQASAPLCGPASIIFWYVVRWPYIYIHFAQSMFETGEYTDDVSHFHVTSTVKHKNSEIKHDMDPADWMLLVALRTTANLILDVDQLGDLWGVTTPGEMKTWTRDFLGFANADSNDVLLGDQTEVLQKAERAVNSPDSEGAASFLVDATVVEGTDTVISLPNHWIAYISNLAITETQVKFRAFTWGQLCDITADKAEWQSKAFGVVWGASPDVTP